MVTDIVDKNINLTKIRDGCLDSIFDLVLILDIDWVDGNLDVGRFGSNFVSHVLKFILEATDAVERVRTKMSTSHVSAHLAAGYQSNVDAMLSQKLGCSFANAHRSSSLVGRLADGRGSRTWRNDDER
jgi:hypothetical protein